ncbi:PP2C family protein-serine/threonine phosphatase [Streptomyces sp. NPDC059637]|uniref:PP2C family protein-serine/threonine phosphatase n=1 Tax=Streptomyces sp. NPDC059637 TaxID=3347752 RepID=UPI0036C2B6DF
MNPASPPSGAPHTAAVPPSRSTVRAAPEVLEALARRGPSPVVVCDGAGRAVLVGEAAAALLPGLEEGAVLGPGTVPAWLARGQELAAAAGDGAVEVRGDLAGRTATARSTALPGGFRAWTLVDAAPRDAAGRHPDDEHGRMEFLDRASARLLASLNRRRSVAATAELAAELADAAAVITSSRAHGAEATVAGGRVRPAAVAVPGAELEALPGIAEALARFPPAPSRCLAAGRVPARLLPDGFGAAGSALLVPLPGSGAPVGALLLVRRPGNGAFTAEEEVFARVFAARAGGAISAAALYEDRTETMTVLQRNLLPPVLRSTAGIDLAASYRPARAADLIGGDFYDVHPSPRPGGETAVVLGDVCGKGPEAAVLTGKIRNTLAALRRVEDDHERLLQHLNGALLEEGAEDGEDDRFATLVLAGATPRAPDGDRPGGGILLRLTAAGHPAPLLVRRDGTVEEAPTRGTLVGAVPLVTATTWTTVLEPGETCLLFSDGVTEARGGPAGGEMFGEERLRAALEGCADMPAGAVVERAGVAVSQWLAGNDHDDIVLLGIGAPRRPRPPAGPRAPAARGGTA